MERAKEESSRQRRIRTQLWVISDITMATSQDGSYLIHSRAIFLLSIAELPMTAECSVEISLGLLLILVHFIVN